MDTVQPLLVLAGPTASGKSSFALDCARSLGGEILSIDSVQIYRELDIGSAKISAEERREIPHHLIDILPADAAFNVADFLQHAERAITEIQGRDKTCIACAGTTLYLTALLHGLAAAPPQDEEYRETLAALSDNELHERLKQVDVRSSERLHVNDRVRVTRALEAVHVSGKTLSEFHSDHAYRRIEHPALILVLCWKREQLYARIEERSRLMISAGLVEETRRIRERYPSSHQALRTLGYAQACELLEGRLSEAELAQKISMYTRRYAKRQMTYWRNEPLKRGWSLRPGSDEDARELEAAGNRKHGPAEKSFRVLSMSRTRMLEEIRSRIKELNGKIELWYVDAAALTTMA